MEMSQIKSLLKGVRDTGNDKFMCLCPAHDDKNPSLQVWLDENEYIAINCYAGCSIDIILQKLNLTIGDLVTETARQAFLEQLNTNLSNTNLSNPKKDNTSDGQNKFNNIEMTNKTQSQRTIEKIYDYKDEIGNLVFQNLRYYPKYFSVRHSDPNNKGRWINNIQGCKRYLYRLPELISAVNEGKPIYIVEGEKDVDNLMSLGLAATTNFGGASINNSSNWDNSYNYCLDRAKKVVIIPDADENGYKHAIDIFSKLQPFVSNICYGVFENIPKPKFDSSDIIEHYHIKNSKLFISKIKELTHSEFLNHVASKGFDIENFKNLVPSTDIKEYEFHKSKGYAQHKETGEKVYYAADLGNAYRVFDKYKERLLYNTTNDSWYIWNGKLWVKDERNELTGFITDILKDIGNSKAIIFDGNINTDYKKIVKYFDKCCSNSAYLSILNYLRRLPDIAVNINDFDKDKHLLNLNNGIYNFKTNQLMPHHPEYMMSKIIRINYNPEARCPKFWSFLYKIFDNNDKLVLFIRRALAITFSGESLAEVLFFCYGNGANGKSVFFKILEIIYGDYFQKAPNSMIMQNGINNIPNDIAQLPNKRMVVCAELPDDQRFNESIIKDLTGNDSIQARFLRQEFFTFTPTHTMWLYGNHKPKIHGSDYGIWRRICLIPFAVTIPVEERIPQHELLESFMEELEGILFWILEGYKDYQKVGLDIPDIVKMATNEYKEDNDVILDFINECCTFDGSYKIPTTDLYSAYTLYTKENKSFTIGNRKFFTKVEEKGYHKKEIRSRQKEFVGIKLNEYWENKLKDTN
jgi:putative DNA primase/helicase